MIVLVARHISLKSNLRSFLCLSKHNIFWGIYSWFSFVSMLELSSFHLSFTVCEYEWKIWRNISYVFGLEFILITIEYDIRRYYIHFIKWLISQWNYMGRKYGNTVCRVNAELLRIYSYFVRINYTYCSLPLVFPVRENIGERI